MKKALQISIAKTLFTVEEDAYVSLDTYLAAVKRHFESTEGCDEIVSDIETRIAEQLHESKEAVVTLPTVERVIAQMGGVDDFDDSENAKSASGTEKKKLYRDGDNAIIAGVAAGLAAFFGWSPQWVRIAFLILSLFNGIGILIYIILWIAIPEAKTASQKLEMVGSAVTLGTISETVSERLNEISPDSSGRIARAVAFPFRMILRAIRILIGVGFIVGAGIGIVTIVITTGFLMSGTTWVADDIPLSALLPGVQQWIVLTGAMLAGLIPLIFIVLAGISLLVKRSLVNVQAVLAFLGVWFLALLICGFGAAKVISNYDRAMSTSPQYQEVTREVPLESFSSVTIGNGAHVSIVRGTTTVPVLSVSGTAKYIDSYDAHIEDGVLLATYRPITQSSCLFCSTRHPSLTLTVPSLSAVTVRQGASIRSDAFPAASTFSLTMDNGAYANVSLDTNTFSATLSQGSSLDISGSADSGTFNLSNGSHVDGNDFVITDATVRATRGSSASIHATKTLSATAENGSAVRYVGDAILTEKTDGSSDVDPY